MYNIFVDTNILKYLAFVKTVETGSFTKAGEALHYTQGGISRMVSDLENEWQVSLLTRSKKGIELTEDGKRLLPYAQELCSSFNKVEEEADDLRGLRKGTIRIGAFSSAATYYLPSIIKAFQADYPSIVYELKLGNYEQIESWIEDGEVDCGFLSLPTSNPLDSIFLTDDEAKVVLPQGHILAQKDKISLKDLNDYPFLMLQDGKEKEFPSLFKEKNLKLDIRFSSWDDYSIMAMVEKGLGISILPSLILKRSPFKLEIRSLATPCYRKIAFVLKDRSKASAATKRFIKYLNHRED
jgi:DNA-binding transcriptional LysR family regulator